VFLFSPYLIHAARFPILPLLISVTIFSISDSVRLLWGSLLRGFFLLFGSFFSILKDWSVKLFQDKTFLKKSNKNDLKGKTTTDYFDYAILISNSKANKPIEELDK
jgi:hypothetical protein